MFMSVLHIPVGVSFGWWLLQVYLFPVNDIKDGHFVPENSSVSVKVVDVKSSYEQVM